MSFNIDYDGLAQAMSHHDLLGETLSFFDAETGEVVFVDDWVKDQARASADPDQIDDPAIRLAWYLLWSDGEIGEELPEAEEAILLERAEACLARYLRVPSADSREGYQDMEDFTVTVSNPRLHELLETVLAGKRPFRRFKDALIRYPEERERWFEFSNQRLRERIDDWLREEGILPAE